MPVKNIHKAALTLTACLFTALQFAWAQTVTHGNLSATVKRINDKDAFTQYAIYHDDKAIYIKLYISDSLQKMKVLKNGMELWIDVKGKKNKTAGISFPLSATGGAAPFGPGGNARQGRDTLPALLIAKRKDAEFKGFEGISGKQNIEALTAVADLSVALSLAGDTLVYEATVPFAALAEKPNDKPVSVGIVEKGVELPGLGDMGGGPDGGGGLPGGGDGGPPPGPPPGDMQDGGIDFRRLFETNVIWYKIKLHS